MPTPTNSINVSNTGAVSYNGTSFSGGTLSIANGGTNASSYTQSNGVVTYNGTSLVNYAGPQISSGGVYTNASQAAFSVYLTNTVSDVTGDGTEYTIIYDTALANVGTVFNLGTGVFTAPVAGLYQFNCTLAFIDVGVGTGPELKLNTTGNTFLVTGSVDLGSSNLVMLCGSWIVSMASTNTASISCIMSGTTLTVDVSGLIGVANRAVNTFSGCLVA